MAHREPVSFGTNLRAIRTSAGLTQAQLGERAGLSQNRISELESDGNPPLNTLCALAAALEVDPADLLVCPDDPAPAGAA